MNTSIRQGEIGLDGIDGSLPIIPVTTPHYFASPSNDCLENLCRCFHGQIIGES
ncbi:hypothetical protein Desti_4811 [Desulfomonile tiedjei DSM 6799]|uniref:Uncharacterized protein n=1 Tax=Desulfomonile tiedjei (strain ATCC 49306 / DSM 6799 / DCB-1) TaxID=706587 RepID=I4CCY6_DESTA|nr:hypothetical protein Desti_4811 [Desulfomonile tiedjei DSM 6799]